MKILRSLLVLFSALSVQAGAASYTSPLLLSAHFSNANTYYIAYFDFLSNSAQTIPNNSFLEYDVFLPGDSADFSGSLDMGGAGLADIRDFTSNGIYLRDQNNLRVHPFSDLSGFAKGQWYHRRFDMGSAGGLGLKEACLTTDTGNNSNGAPSNLAGDYNGYFDNIKFTNAYGATLLDLYSNANSLSMTGAPSSGTFPFGYSGAATSTNNLVAVTQALSLVPTAGSIAAGSGMTVTASLTGPGGLPIAGANVRLSVGRSQDTLSSVSGTTDGAGHVQVIVSSNLAGLSSVNAVAGPFTASTSFSFIAGSAVAWRLAVPSQTFVVGNSGTALQVSAKGSLGNVTSTTRSVVISAADAQLQLSTDNTLFFPASLGITLTPSAGPITFYARNLAGAFRSEALLATDSSAAGGPLTSDSATIDVNPTAASGLTLTLPGVAVAGSSDQLTVQAVDGSSNPATSVTTINLSSASPSGMFSLDNGFSWANVTSVALSAGSMVLLYRDTKSGSSQALVASALGGANATVVLAAGAPYVVSGASNPSAVFNNSVDGANYSTLTATVLDAFGNPVSGTTVAFAVIAGGGSLSGASAVTDASGHAQDLLTVGTTAQSNNYVRATVAGIKPTMLNVSAAKPTRLNLSPNPATGGVGVATSFIVLAQDASNPAITGASTAAVRISSTTATLSFSPDASTWSSTLDLTLVSGQAQFYARDSFSTGVTGATITATDLGAILSPGKAVLVIFPASIVVAQVASGSYNVTRGETAVSVTMTVRNTGGTDANLNASIANTYLTFNGSTAGYTISPSPSNPTVVPAGASVLLQFNVTVLASAGLGATVLNGHVSGTDSVTGAILNDGGGTAITGLWQVAGVATHLLIYTAGGTPVAGTPFSVTVVALDASNNTVSTFAQGLTVSTRLVASPGVTATGQVNTSFPVFDRGVAVYNSDYTLVEGVYLRADAGGLGANSVGLTPVAAALNLYRIYNPSTAFVGQPFSVTIAAMDQYGNTRSGAVAVTLTANGGGGLLAVTWKNLAAGLVSFANEAYNLAQSIRIFANDGTITSNLAETTPIAVISYTATISPSATVTATPTDTASSTVSPTGTFTRTFSPSPSITFSPSISPTFSVSPSSTVTPPFSFTFTVTPSSTDTPSMTTTNTATPTTTSTVTLTTSPTSSSTGSPTTTSSSTISATLSSTATVTPTSSDSSTATSSPSCTISATRTQSPSDTVTGTLSPTSSVSPTSTGSPSSTTSATATDSATPTLSPTMTATPSVTNSFSASPSISVTSTFTSSVSPSNTPSPTSSATVTDTATQTPSYTRSPSFTVSPTFSASPSITLSVTISPTWSVSPTITVTPSITPSFSASPSFSVTGTFSTTPTATATMTGTASPSVTGTATATSTPSASATASLTATGTATLTPSWTVSPTPTITPTFSASPSITPTFTISPTPSASPTASPTFTAVSQVAVAPPRPNPFWPLRGQRLYLDVDVATPGAVKVKAFNLAGELVMVIADKDVGNGRTVLSWDGRNANGDAVASGVYFILVEAPGGLQQRFLVGVLK